jgi:ABC-type multidrug transport system fused ATPase/permease subunit
MNLWKLISPNSKEDELSNLWKPVWQSMKKDVFVGIGFTPLYSSAEAAVVFTSAALIKLISMDKPRIPAADFIPSQIQRFLAPQQMLDRADLVFIVPAFLIGAGFLKMAFGGTCNYMLERSGHRASYALRKLLQERVLRSNGILLSGAHPEQLSSQIMSDTASFQNCVGKGILNAIKDVVTLSVLLICFVLVSGWLAFVLLPLLIVFGFFLKKDYWKAIILHSEYAIW